MTSYADAVTALNALLYTGGRGRITPENMATAIVGVTDALQSSLDEHADIIPVANLTEAAALTGLHAGDIIHVVNNGEGTWGRYQIESAADGTWTGATKTALHPHTQEATFYKSRAAAMLSAIDSYVRIVWTGGYDLPGDGGFALHKEAETEPTHNGKFQSTDGRWWELVEAQPNLKQFGGKGDYNTVTGTGSSNNTALTNALSYSAELFVPSGDYLFSGYPLLSDLLRSTIYGPGRLWYDNGSYIEQIGSRVAAGVCDPDGNLGAITQGGFIVGGEGPDNNGTLWRSDGCPSWSDFVPTRSGSAIELQVYNTAIKGLCVTVNGTAYIDATYGDFSSTNVAVGDVLGVGQALYKIKTKVSNTRLELETTAGGSVTFSGATTLQFTHAYYYADGVCDVAGTTVTRKTGAYFFNVAEYASQHKLILPSGTYTVSAVVDGDELTLATSAGTSTGVAYTQKVLSLALNSTLFRLQGLQGSVETNFALYLTINNKIRLASQASTAGGASYPPIEFLTGSNYDIPSGGERHTLVLSKDGRVGIGKDFEESGWSASDPKVTVWRDKRVAHTSNGSDETHLLSIESTFNGSGYRAIDAGFFNNFNAGFIQGYVSSDKTLYGPLVINPHGGSVGIGTGATTTLGATLDVTGNIRGATGVTAGGAAGLKLLNTATQQVQFDGGSSLRWRAISTINGATDGNLVIQHTTDGFVSNFLTGGQFVFSGGLSTWEVGGDTTPVSNDGGALGTTSKRWSDLRLAAGAVIDINGNWVATHSSGVLTVGTGDLRVTTAGTNAASVVTVGGTQTLTNKTLDASSKFATHTVATLPAAAGAGACAQAWVTDSSVAYTSANLGSIVAGGGSNLVPVYSDTTNWRIG